MQITHGNFAKCPSYKAIIGGSFSSVNNTTATLTTTYIVCVSETHQSEYNVCVSETLCGTSNVIIVLYHSQLQQPFHKCTRSQCDELTKTILSQRRHCRSISSRSFKKQQRSNNKTKPTTSRSAKPSSHSTNYGHNVRRRHRRKNHLPRN